MAVLNCYTLLIWSKNQYFFEFKYVQTLKILKRRYRIHAYAMCSMFTPFVHSRHLTYHHVHCSYDWSISMWSLVWGNCINATKNKKYKLNGRGKYVYIKTKHRGNVLHTLHMDAVVILLADRVQSADSPLFHDGWWPMHTAHKTTSIHTHTHITYTYIIRFYGTRENNVNETSSAHRNTLPIFLSPFHSGPNRSSERTLSVITGLELNFIQTI